ncbi:MAG: class A beta-lactamase-related serine hydrolase [Saprospirales bacterium]|nr:MAG: class A beta-lactamase-related serine hydrolase [Saprospirales bacterium]
MKIMIALGCLMPFVSSGQDFDSEKLVNYLNLLEEKNRAMGSIAISESGEEVFSHSFGYSRVEKGEKAGDHTIYRVGSVSKTFTAALVLLLKDEGKLQLDDPISTYFDGLPNGDKITIRHLLLHRSGLFNFTNSENYTDWMEEEQSREKLLTLFRGQEPEFEPAERTEYSNTNFVLLSFLIEDLADMTFSEALKKKITEPLGLKNTFITNDINNTENHAQSYNFTGEWKVSTETHPSVPLGAGALSSTTADLNQFLESLFGGRLITEESLKEMTNPVNGFGMGIFQLPFYDMIMWGHTGGIDGYMSVFAWHEKKQLAVSANFNGLSMSMNDILIATLSLYLGKDFEIPEITAPMVLSEEELIQYTGYYTSETFPLNIRITAEGNTLMGQATGQPPFPLEPRGDHIFTLDQVGLRLTFEPEENKMVLKQGGMNFVMYRSGDEE